MSLPDITSRLPRSIDSPQSRRLRTFLLHVDEKLEHPWTITIYGSAAVAFYLADEEHQERAYTRDIDIGDMEPDQAEENFQSDIVDPPLHFQAYPFTQWLHHPDWSDAVIDVSDLIGSQTSIVRLLHPCDLIHHQA